MKAIFIAASLILWFYSTQTLENKKSKIIIPEATEWDDTLVYGPQLPCYYTNAISEYVRRIFQDSKGNLWFGTNSDGLAMFDGKNLSYLNVREGLSGSQITGILEEKNGILWFATNNGITRYNPSEELAVKKNMHLFTEKEGLSSSSTWNIFQDSKGTIWAGTSEGLCRFNGKTFESFPIQGAEKSWVRSITEDKQGNLWIATADKGAFKFNGKTVERFSKKDGLCSNDLTCILADRNGNLWFGSMDGGLSKFNGKSFRNFSSEKEIGNNEVWTIYEDPEGTIWFTSEGFGIYSYVDGKLTHFGEKEGLHIRTAQSIFRDRSKRLWIGGGSGVAAYLGGRFTPVTKDGPWDDGC